MKPKVVARVRDEIIAGRGTAEPELLNAATRASSNAIGGRGLRAVTGGVAANLYGAGPLRRLIELPGVTDVLVNGPNDVWIDRGSGLERVDLDLGSEAQVRALAVRLAAAAGRRLDDAEPAVDARLADGVRLPAVLPPLPPHGTTLSPRVPSPPPLSYPE